MITNPNHRHVQYPVVHISANNWRLDQLVLALVPEARRHTSHVIGEWTHPRRGTAEHLEFSTGEHECTPSIAASGEEPDHLRLKQRAKVTTVKTKGSKTGKDNCGLGLASGRGASVRAALRYRLLCTVLRILE